MTDTRSKSGIGPVGKFAHDILVCCPRCGSMAHVVDLVRLSCSNCHFAQSRTHRRLFGPDGASYEAGGNHADWHGAFTLIATGSPRCAKCGDMLLVPIRSRPTSPPAAGHTVALEARCRVCDVAPPVEAIWVPQFHLGEARDPVFGCALYLRQELPRGTLWAYNEAHAAALLAWVMSGSRSRNGETIPDTMASRLPAWIKSRANRSVVAKALKRFEQRAREK
jgi:ribosomal protein L37E